MIKTLSIISALIFANAMFAISESEVPSWVPQRKRAQFIEYIKKNEKVNEMAAELSAIYKDKFSSKDCVILPGKRAIQYKRVRHTLQDTIRVTYNRVVDSCEIEDGEVAVDFEADKEYGTWAKIRDNGIWLLIGIGIGTLIGFLSRK